MPPCVFPGSIQSSVTRRGRNAQLQSVALQIFGIVGTNVAPDRNYIAHNAAYKAVGLKAIYLAYMTENFATFLQAATQHKFAGFSVTMPFKVGFALPFLL